MSEQNEQDLPQGTATPAETEKPKTTFVKITREQFDKVLRYGADAFLQNQLPKMTAEQLANMDTWVRTVRAQKAANVYLTFPVRQTKQEAAGNLYLKALSRIQVRVREIRALAEAQAEFTTPAAVAAPEAVAA